MIQETERKKYVILILVQLEIGLNNLNQRINNMSKLGEGDIVEIRCTVSRGRETYGYNIISLYLNGVKESSCMHGGYDMAGTCLGMYMKDTYADDLQKVNCKDLYGFQHINTKTHRPQRRGSKNSYVSLDGGCGWNCMTEVLGRLGWGLRYSGEAKNRTMYYTVVKRRR